MIRNIECEKICLKADEGKMLYNASIDTYTPKAYLFAEAEAAEWTEVDASAVPVAEDEADDTERSVVPLGDSV